ncbi:FtsX-like permease family protein [Panacibacter ginsenosidivorans]|uniref:FtsX-like permease family protein n=1 Tax=Panacibacter ginsenosidivorans TaxID=1813871 RepID=A0A5B8V464_9BACT|nr:ABC transporter permease [Panacibacter ginsenosidivorans]QEC65969.1 FtsX-like permease family protein [Panacibacter ginsenosidivorans]
MFKNYFTIALRNLSRNKIYAFINIAGLSIGLACAMLILLYVKDEVSYDRFHDNVQNIYRITTQQFEKDGGKGRKDGNTGALQGPRFTANVPGIKTFVRVQSGYEDIKMGNEVKSQDLLKVDSSFFSVFSFPLLSGDRKSCLAEPHSVVISEDVAKKQFGTTDALGKIIMLKEDTVFVPYKVTAISKKCPQNSSIKFDMLVPINISAEDASNNENWFNFFLNTFVVLKPNTNMQAVETKMQRFYTEDSKDALKVLTEKYGDMGWKSVYQLQSFVDMHLSVELPPQNGLSDASNPMYSYILSGIALFILLIACINFVNLTVARSVKRAKEIGIRKVVGGDRKQLIMQFLGESFLLCFIAFVFAIILVQLVLPLFNSLSNKVLAISYLFDAKLIAAYLVLFLVTGLLAGFYPALVLSGYNPVQTLYSRFNLSGKNYLQKTLVVLQFSLASFLIIATFTIYAQFNYLTTEKLGYDDSNLVMINKNNLTRNEVGLLKTELMKNPNIIDVAPRNGGQWGTAAKVNGDSVIQFTYETVNESYIPLLKIPILQGRNFSAQFPSDSTNSVLVNESFVKKAGWKNPVGQTVDFWYDNKKYTVIGVVKDYHFNSLNQEIGPELFTMKAGNTYGMAYIKIKPNSETSSLKQIEQTYKKLFPLNPYSYTFKNEANIRSYEAEAKWKQIMLFSAILTIFVSCIGLFGLSVLSAEKRTKEIGIRKVLGASVSGVVTILSKDFLKLVAIALIIAIPLAWMAANKWLENYPYRIELSWQMFAAAGALVIFIALVTVSFQAVRAALSNPAKSLRTE